MNLHKFLYLVRQALSWRTYFYPVKWWVQRLFRGWSENEVWCLYYSASKKILPMLKHLRKHHHGVGMVEGVDQDASYEEMEKAWYEVIDKIIRTHELIVLDYDDIFSTEPYDLTTAHKQIEARDKEIEEGLYLFAKYYRLFWD